MKRSEMVDIIMDELAGHLNYDTMPLIVASELLAKLEEAGMYPPHGKYIKAGFEYDLIHKWEDE